MDWIKTILKILENGSEIWKLKERNKYAKEVLELKEQWQNEMDKPRYEYRMDPKGDYRNNDTISRVERRLRDLAEIFADSIGG